MNGNNESLAGGSQGGRGKPDEQVFEGQHDALTDEATFEKVQMLLDQHRASGERPQHRHHYLKGSVYCKACELR